MQKVFRPVPAATATGGNGNNGNKNGSAVDRSGPPPSEKMTSIVQHPSSPTRRYYDQHDDEKVLYNHQANKLRYGNNGAINHNGYMGHEGGSNNNDDEDEDDNNDLPAPVSQRGGFGIGSVATTTISKNNNFHNSNNQNGHIDQHHNINSSNNRRRGSESSDSPSLVFLELEEEMDATTITASTSTSAFPRRRNQDWSKMDLPAGPSLRLDDDDFFFQLIRQPRASSSSSPSPAAVGGGDDHGTMKPQTLSSNPLPQQQRQRFFHVVPKPTTAVTMSSSSLQQQQPINEANIIHHRVPIEIRKLEIELTQRRLPRYPSQTHLTRPSFYPLPPVSAATRAVAGGTVSSTSTSKSPNNGNGSTTTTDAKVRAFYRATIEAREERRERRKKALEEAQQKRDDAKARYRAAKDAKKKAKRQQRQEQQRRRTKQQHHSTPQKSLSSSATTDAATAATNSTIERGSSSRKRSADGGSSGNPTRTRSAPAAAVGATTTTATNDGKYYSPSLTGIDNSKTAPPPSPVSSRDVVIVGRSSADSIVTTTRSVASLWSEQTGTSISDDEFVYEDDNDEIVECYYDDSDEDNDDNYVTEMFYQDEHRKLQQVHSRNLEVAEQEERQRRLVAEQQAQQERTKRLYWNGQMLAYKLEHYRVRLALFLIAKWGDEDAQAAARMRGLPDEVARTAKATWDVSSQYQFLLDFYTQRSVLKEELFPQEVEEEDDDDDYDDYDEDDIGYDEYDENGELLDRRRALGAIAKQSSYSSRNSHGSKNMPSSLPSMPPASTMDALTKSWNAKQHDKIPIVPDDDDDTDKYEPQIGVIRPSLKALIVQAMTELRTRKVPEEHKTKFEPSFLEAVQVGRFTRLKEHIIEAMGTKSSIAEQPLLPSQTWQKGREYVGLPKHDNTRSEPFMIFNEAAAMGKMKALKPQVTTNYNGLDGRYEYARINNRHDNNHNQNMNQTTNIDDENMHKVIRTNYLTDMYVADHRKEKSSIWDAANLAEEQVHYDNLDDVQLPTEECPVIKPNAKALHGRELKDAIAQAVAEASWDRRYRLERPRAQQRIKSHCSCKYCHNANPYQTHAYRKKWLLKQGLYYKKPPEPPKQLAEEKPHLERALETVGEHKKMGLEEDAAERTSPEPDGDLEDISQFQQGTEISHVANSQHEAGIEDVMDEITNPDQRNSHEPWQNDGINSVKVAESEHAARGIPFDTCATKHEGLSQSSDGFQEENKYLPSATSPITAYHNPEALESEDSIPETYANNNPSDEFDDMKANVLLEPEVDKSKTAAEDMTEPGNSEQPERDLDEDIPNDICQRETEISNGVNCHDDGGIFEPLEKILPQDENDHLQNGNIDHKNILTSDCTPLDKVADQCDNLPQDGATNNEENEIMQTGGDDAPDATESADFVQETPEGDKNHDSRNVFAPRSVDDASNDVSTKDDPGKIDGIKAEAAPSTKSPSIDVVSRKKVKKTFLFEVKFLLGFANDDANDMSAAARARRLRKEKRQKRQSQRGRNSGTIRSSSKSSGIGVFGGKTSAAF